MDCCGSYSQFRKLVEVSEGLQGDSGTSAASTERGCGSFSRWKLVEALPPAVQVRRTFM